MPDAKRVPLGSGLAGNARSLLINRRRNIDEQVDAAVSGESGLKIKPYQAKKKKKK